MAAFEKFLSTQRDLADPEAKKAFAAMIAKMRESLMTSHDAVLTERILTTIASGFTSTPRAAGRRID